MPAKRCIDFLVIGAQKAGTTTVFRHLAAHPAIHMPAGKELNFFAKPERYARGLDWYLARHFADADPGRIWGEASPLYMAVPEAPERIRRSAPQARLVALLRDPVERARSHHGMAVRRGWERRDLLSCVRARLDAGGTARTRDPERDYVGLGEYARILAGFLERFPRERIWVGFSEELARRPETFMARLYAFLGVDSDFRPPQLGRRFHASGPRRFPPTLRRAVRRTLKAAGPLVGRGRSRALRLWFETELNTRPGADGAMDPQARDLLTRHYRADVARLETLLAREVSWSALR